MLSPDNAAGQLKRLEEHIIGLEEFPDKFRPYEKEPWHSRGLRVMPVDNYLVFYIPNKDAGIVTNCNSVKAYEMLRCEPVSYAFLRFIKNGYEHE